MTDPSQTPRSVGPWAAAALTLIQGLLPVMTALLGGLWVVFTYLDNQQQLRLKEEAAKIEALKKEESARADSMAQAQKAAETRRLEAQRPFLDKQLALYFETAQVIGVIIGFAHNEGMAGDPWQAAATRFWALYWSELAMVEDRDVASAMVVLGTRLQEYEKMRTERSAPDSSQGVVPRLIAARENVKTSALGVAHAIRDSIATRWVVGK